MAFGLAVNLTPPAGRARLFLQGLVLATTLVVCALLGWPLLRAALRECRRRRLTIEALFVLTIGGAMAASLQSFISGQRPI